MIKYILRNEQEETLRVLMKISFLKKYEFHDAIKNVSYKM